MITNNDLNLNIPSTGRDESALKVDTERLLFTGPFPFISWRSQDVPVTTAAVLGEVKVTQRELEDPDDDVIMAVSILKPTNSHMGIWTDFVIYANLCVHVQNRMYLDVDCA